ncbi:dehydrogenase/reductase SDR family member X [Sarotherodon galilaeus]
MCPEKSMLSSKSPSDSTGATGAMRIHSVVDGFVFCRRLCRRLCGRLSSQLCTCRRLIVTIRVIFIVVLFDNTRASFCYSRRRGFLFGVRGKYHAFVRTRVFGDVVVRLSVRVVNVMATVNSAEGRAFYRLTSVRVALYDAVIVLAPIVNEVVLQVVFI